MNRNMNLVTSGTGVAGAGGASNGANTRKKPFKWGK